MGGEHGTISEVVDGDVSSEEEEDYVIGEGGDDTISKEADDDSSSEGRGGRPTGRSSSINDAMGLGFYNAMGDTGDAATGENADKTASRQRSVRRRQRVHWTRYQ